MSLALTVAVVGRVCCYLQRPVAQVIFSSIDVLSDESELPTESFAVATVVELAVGRFSRQHTKMGLMRIKSGE